VGCVVSIVSIDLDECKRKTKQGHYYSEVKRLIPNLPLGSTIVLPTVYFGASCLQIEGKNTTPD
jgi:hypothetical protein